MEAASGPVVALVGNPNVGKSTLFNALTHLRQHTGNWPGKTVEVARGSFSHRGVTYTLIDLPGAYSLHPGSAEEEVTRDFLLSGEAEVTLVVVDATCLERNLPLVLQVMETAWPVAVCVNLMDEAARKQIHIDLPKLQDLLGCPVAGAAARSGRGLPGLLVCLADTAADPPPPPRRPSLAGLCPCRRAAVLSEEARRIAGAVLTADQAAAHRLDRRLDRVLTSRAGGIPAMLLLLAGILWLTMAGANVPSEWLSRLLFGLREPLRELLRSLSAPWWLEGAVADGIYQTTAWVVAVMLPPMAIFFPLFTLLEDIGYLPRVAFNMDHFFHRSGAHGRQALTMCMGLGCNACGVMGCRIIQSPRERLIAILTNAFMPCNGRFPTLMALIALFFAAGEGLWGSLAGAALLLGCIVLAVVMTLWSSRLLSATVLRGLPSAFSLELPPYRLPRLGQVLVRSLLDRTLFVLGRAVTVAAPAGLLIWVAANVTVGGESLFLRLAGLLEGPGRFLGMDGVILLAFLLGFPANEIVMPCILMGYLSAGSLTGYQDLPQLRAILTANGWSAATALSVLLFTLFHFPCGTTCLTIWRETKSPRWTALAIALPLAAGVILCSLVRLAAAVLPL